ncbi:MAG: InlB B-repeat-containing protein [Treponema sp.]|jgi:hypothetical protein|nr:InlB B-repeat-containing protein [Treponema sp.]
MKTKNKSPILRALFLLGFVLTLAAACSLGESDKAHVITFDTGAELTTESVKPTGNMTLEMYPGELLEELPEPYYSGYQFRGWYNRPEEGEVFETPWEVNGDLRLYAYWGRGADPAGDYRVEFDPNGGTINGGGNTLLINVKRPPWTVFNLPYPVKGDNAFGGWFTETSSGPLPAESREITVLTPVTGFAGADGLVRGYAYWYAGSRTFTVTFNANGGGWGPGEFTKTAAVTVPAATTLVEAGTWPVNPELAGFPMTGWFTSPGDVEFTGDSKVTKDITVAAKWVYSALDSIDYGIDDNDQFTGVLPGGGTVNPVTNNATSVETVNGYKALKLPTKGTSVLDLGQIAGSYFAEPQFTMEVYLNVGESERAGSTKAIRFHTDRGEEADGALWMEGHGLIVFRPNTGTRPQFALSANNQWFHLALVKDGTTITAITNGNLETASSSNLSTALGNANFKEVSHCKFYNLTNGMVYKVIFHKGVVTEFPGAQDTINALNGTP